MYQTELFNMEYSVLLGLNLVSQLFRQYSGFNSMSALCKDLHDFYTTLQGTFHRTLNKGYHFNADFFKIKNTKVKTSQ